MTLPRKPFASKPRKALAPISDAQLKKRKAAGEQFITSTIRPTKAKKATTARQGTKPDSTDPDEPTVEAAMKRAAGKCESCGDELYGRRGFEYSIHHRKRRSQGGDNRLSNLVVLCGHGTSQCHGHVHSEIAQARLAGFLLLSTENPEDVPVDLAKGQSRLTNDGEAIAIQAIREEDHDYADPF